MRPPKVVAGQALSVREHPNGDYVRLAEVDIGSGSVVQIVFGGPSLLLEGDLVPVALPGARLPGRKKLRRTSFRGEPSHGMFCSTTELDWEENGPDEVALLRDDLLKPGDSLEDVDWNTVKAEETPFHMEQRKLWLEHLHKNQRPRSH
jgi:tRNA-binding EMAP/Myf-like protein